MSESAVTTKAKGELEIQPRAEVSMGVRGFELRTLDEAWRFGQALIRGRMVPKGLTDPGAVVAIMQAGAELSIPYMQALSSLTFINGRLGIMGDAAKALVRNRGGLEPGTDIEVRYEGEGDSRRCVVTAQPKGKKLCESGFGVKEAKAAGLWKKAGPWTEYSDRMLMYRAWGFLARDAFSEILMGLVIAEELRDYPPAAQAAADRPEPPGADPLLAAQAAAPEAPEPEAESEVEPTRPPPCAKHMPNDDQCGLDAEHPGTCIGASSLKQETLI